MSLHQDKTKPPTMVGRQSAEVPDLSYHCDVNRQTAQPQWGVITVFKLMGHTGIDWFQQYLIL